jgi:amino acid permease
MHFLIRFFCRFWQGFEEQKIVQLDLEVWILIVFLVVFPSIFVRKPVFLAWFSIVANIFLALSTVAVFVNIFSTTSDWKIDNTVEWPKLPLTFGMTLFAFEIAPFVSYHYIDV